MGGGSCGCEGFCGCKVSTLGIKLLQVMSCISTSTFCSHAVNSTIIIPPRHHPDHIRRRGSVKMKVYRLRNIPSHADRYLAAELIAGCVRGLSPHQIRISSLALAIDPWARTPTKTATLTLEFCNSDIELKPGQEEWAFSLPGLPKPLLLDQHFRGLTPLNDVNPETHKYEYFLSH